MLSPEQKKHLDQRGFALLKGILSPDETNALRERAVALAREEKAAGRGFTYLDDKAQRVWNLVNKGEIFEQAIQRPEVLGPMEYLLGEDLTLSSFTVNIIGPGAPASHLHLDLPLARLPLPRPSFALCANSMWILDDFTLENGATCCVSGSHLRLEEMPEPEGIYPEALQIEAPRGSIMIMNGGVWHSSGANRTERERVALLGFFCRSILKPQQDHLKIVAPEVVARATPKLKQLLGCDSQPQTHA